MAVPRATPLRPPTIDMTVDGELLAPPPRWTGPFRFWQALPRGALPALLLATVAVLACVVLLLGLALLALPAFLLLACSALVLRVLAPRRRRGG